MSLSIARANLRASGSMISAEDLHKNGIPPRFDAIKATPDAIASRHTSGQESLHLDGARTIPARRYNSGNSSLGRYGSNRIRLPLLPAFSATDLNLVSYADSVSFLESVLLPTTLRLIGLRVNIAA